MGYSNFEEEMLWGSNITKEVAHPRRSAWGIGPWLRELNHGATVATLYVYL